MPRRSLTPAAEARQRLPYVVELPEKPGGWGHRLSELVAWCQAQIPRDRWFVYGGEFRFAAPDDAAAFAAESARNQG